MKAIDTHVHPGTKEDVIDCGGKYIEDASPVLRAKRWKSFDRGSTGGAVSVPGCHGDSPGLGCGDEHRTGNGFPTSTSPGW